MVAPDWLRAAARVAVAAVLAGCGPVQAPPGAVDAPAPASLAAPLAPADLAAADLDRGELLSLACQACHSFQVGGPHGIGPNLAGIFGEPAAIRAEFAYSDALQSAGLVWSPETLDRWLANPADFVSGSSMTFAGYADPTDRRDLIAYLVATLGSAPR